MKYYKLTDQDMRTYRGCQWELGKWKKTSGEGPLCTNGWIHCYTHPLLAVLLNPIHANFKEPRIFETEVNGKSKDDYGLKIGWSKVKLTRELPLPEVTPEQKVRFGILCALEVYKDKPFVEWAMNWLSNKDRTAESAGAAAEAARAAAGAAAEAAEAAAEAAGAAGAAGAAWAVGEAVEAAARAAEAAWAAVEAAWAERTIDLISLAEKSLGENS